MLMCELRHPKGHRATCASSDTHEDIEPHAVNSNNNIPCELSQLKVGEPQAASSERVIKNAAHMMGQMQVCDDAVVSTEYTLALRPPTHVVREGVCILHRDHQSTLRF